MQLHSTLSCLSITCLLIATLCSCADSDSSPATTRGLSVHEDKDATLSTLDPQERATACERVQAYHRDGRSDAELRYATCLLATLTTRGGDAGPEACEAEVAACVDALPNIPLDIPCDPDALSACEATVAEYEACERSRKERADATTRGLSCESAPGEVPSPASTLSAACERLYDQCPELGGSCPGCETPTRCGEDGRYYCDACELEQAGVEPAADPATCGPNPNNLNNPNNSTTACDESCPEPKWCGEDGNLYCSYDQAAACYGVPNGTADLTECDDAPTYRFVLIEDASPVGDAAAPGAQIDAIGVGLLPGGEIAHWATSVEDFLIGGADNSFSDVSGLLGAPDAACEVQNVTALGGAESGGYVIVGFGTFEEDVKLTSGTSILVEELGPTSCPDQGGWVDNEVMVSVSSSAGRDTFFLLGTISEGSNAITIP